MSRKLFILVIALFCFIVSVSVWADEAEDVQQIRELLYKEQEGTFKGERDKIMSCYALGFVGYRAWTSATENPNDLYLASDSFNVFSAFFRSVMSIKIPCNQIRLFSINRGFAEKCIQRISPFLFNILHSLCSILPEKIS